MRASAVVPLVPLAVFIALAAACAAPPAAAPAAPPKPDETAIRAALDTELGKFGPAIAAKNAAAVASLFTDDATWVLPDATSYTGRASIETGAKKFFESFESAEMGQMTIEKLVVVNDSEAVTFTTGTYTMTERGKGKKPAKHVNPFADYWKKGSDGVWRVAYEINADGPVPAAASAKP